MAPWNQFAMPAGISDFDPNTEAGKVLARLWTANLNRWTDAAILGDPWGSTDDQDRSFYVNPLKIDMASAAPLDPIRWIAFPGRIIEFYKGTLSDELLNAMADFGGVPGMPRDVCPPGDTTPIAYTPVGPRGWQDEYCEWSVRRNGDKVVSVMFTCENPEYWLTLWRVSPARVLEVYQSLVGPAVKMEDLTLKDSNGEVTDPATGRPAYNPINRWNFGTVTLPDRGGAVHLTSSPNTLSAEIYLAAAATILRKDGNGQQLVTADDLICCTHYGRPKRNSDPLIGASVNQGISAAPWPKVTLADPVGLYIQDPDWSNWQLPANAPAGAKPSDYWKVKRGKGEKDADGFSMTLHAVYEVPADQGFSVSDIKINGQNIRYGSQIARTFKVGLRAIAIPSGAADHPLLPCPGDRAAPLPVASLIQDRRVYDAARVVELRANEIPLSISTLCYEIRQGTAVDAYLLLARGGADVTASVPEGGVTITIDPKGVREIREGVLCQVRITADQAAALGDRTVLIKAQDGTSGPVAPGLLTVVTAVHVAPAPHPLAVVEGRANVQRPQRR